MVIYGSGKPPYGPIDIVVEDGLISYIGSPRPRRRHARRRRRDRRHRQVRDAGHRQHAHALARGAPAGHPAADPVRAQSVPGRRRHDRARGRRRLRQVEALAGREQRAHDHLAAHPRLPGRQQGPDRQSPDEIRAWVRDIKQRRRRRPQDHRAWIAISSRRCMDEAHSAWGCARPRTSASKRRRRSDYIELGVELDRALLRRRRRGARRARRTSRRT